MFLIDTDTMIYALKGDEQVSDGFRRHASFPKMVSVITYGELLYGAMKSRRREENLAKVRRIAELFPVVELSRGITETYADIKTSLESRGSRLDDFDLLIASTALVLGLTLVTNNERHFRRVPGLQVDNWSKSSAS